MKPFKQLTVKLFLSSLVLLAITFSNREALAAPDLESADFNNSAAIEDESGEELTEDVLNLIAIKQKIQSFFSVKTVFINSLFYTYSNSSEITNLIKNAGNQVKKVPNEFLVIKPGKKTQAYCYGAVRTALQSKNVNLIPESCSEVQLNEEGLLERVDCFVSKRKREGVGSAFAKDAVEDLSMYGFINILTDPRFAYIAKELENNPIMAPKGSLLVYETTEQGLEEKVHEAGHIEIKSEEAGVGGYISVSITNVPTKPRKIPEQRILIGVMIKESLISIVPLASK